MRPSLMRRSTTLGQRKKYSPLRKAQRSPRTPVLPLAHRLAKDDGRRRGAFDTRADIVSPALCDDILGYMAPSLNQYKNCDIIDVNPGAGLWSSKLHDFLNPRRHVLLEPDDFYKPFLQPLLDAPGSTYINGPANDNVLASLANTFLQGLLPDQHPLPQGDARLSEPNTSLLLLLNLSRVKARNPRLAYFTTREVLNDLSCLSWAHRGLGRYGQVRMLVWIGEYFKERILPRDLNQVDSHGLSFHRKTHTHSIAEHHSAKVARDDTTLELASAVRAADRMRSAGLVIPSHRQSRLHQMALSLLKDRDAQDIQAELRTKIIPEQSPVEELEELQALFKSKACSKPNLTPWRERMDYLQSCTEKALKDRRRSSLKLVPTWVIYDEMRRLEMIVVDEVYPAQERLAAKERWEKLKLETYKLVHEETNKGTRQTLYNIIDQRRAFYQNPSLLQWDNRSFEPLTTVPHEFYPQQSLCLLDVTPNPPLREHPLTEQNYWQRFATKLFERCAHPVGKTLDYMRHGSAEVIMPEAGRIHDPRRGGSLDVEDVRVRNLTPEMIDELVDAWKNWTFRPEDLEKAFTESRADFSDHLDADNPSIRSFYA
ncbi:hypothetical protein SLS58_009839 [Diplodia intermedia]|uniref:Mitochondrial transcription factor 1 n=1 Tax=Diplodia intermedia TaxID=856260 RepID=A0ABR3TAN0_9PEZI